MQANEGLPAVVPFSVMSRLPVLRQIGLLGGLAVSVALGLSIFNWVRNPEYQVLYNNLRDLDSAHVVEELQRQAIPYRIEPGSGVILVPSRNIHDARMGLARAGISASESPGIDLLQTSGPLGNNSELMETARYQHALEAELARSIQTITSIRQARVHLALPKQSAFIRDRQAPSASVLVSLNPGRRLDDVQVNAIMNMVAAGVPNMNTAQVTVIDQNGSLLSPDRERSELTLSREQFESTRRLEEIYIERIEHLLIPIAGFDGVRAQVVIDMDYTVTEQAQEQYVPDQNIVRSEQIEEKLGPNGTEQAGASGIPGASSNQDQTVADPGGTDVSADTRPANLELLKSTRNYEVGRTVSHTRSSPGAIRRIAAAIVLDDRKTLAEDGTVTRTPLSEEEISRITLLVKEAIGFREDRGDSVHVSNTSFIVPPTPEPLPEPTLLEQEWIWPAARMLLGVIGFLLLVFGVLRPVMRSLAVAPIHNNVLVGHEAMLAAPDNTPNVIRQRMGYDEELSAARAIVAQDPRRVAQVVKNWVGNDA